MSRLDELIAELCPNGVEYKSIGEISTDIYRGSSITRDQVTKEGKLLSMLLNSIKDLGFGLGHIIQIAQSLQGLDEKEKKQLQEALLKHSITVFLH